MGFFLRQTLRAWPAAGCLPLFVLTALLAIFSIRPDHSLAAPASVMPTVETTPVPDAGDAADDVAIWIHPTDPSLSTVIGTDKLASGGLGVYNLAGNQLYFYF